ncbi:MULTISPECIES: isochorismatase family protein [unclassified Klebsiella]|uniref:isochorismatase family protein n=1 Tax=unclassified Klebsiella TaxID=2608929 RepID=UPI000C2A17C3|nr:MULTISPECIES: isochorismatase family protein [unclassified Klebsiella]PJX56595.1 MerR family transcriptional regulator [Klebsiella sp. F-Nf9]PKJ70379.1 MerR family transcriptional regulator [Klebsiella sp. X1-16S-Nf21]
MYDKLLTVSDAAKMLGISASTLRRLEENGEVKTYGLKVVYTPGGQRRYLADEIQRVFTQTGFAHKIGFGNKAAILVRDVTYAFMDSGSTLAIDTPFDKQGLHQLLTLAAQRGLPTIFTRTVYRPEHAFSWLWGKKYPFITRLTEDAYLNQIDEALANAPFSRNHETYYISDFFGNTLDVWLKQQGIDTIILGGVTASGSIRATAIEAFQMGFHVMVPREVIGDRSQSLLDFTLLDLNARYADVLSLEEVSGWLTTLPFVPGDSTMHHCQSDELSE